MDEELEETLAVLGDPDLLARVREGDEQLARGEGIPYELVKSELLADRAPQSGDREQ